MAAAARSSRLRPLSKPRLASPSLSVPSRWRSASTTSAIWLPSRSMTCSASLKVVSEPTSACSQFLMFFPLPRAPVRRPKCRCPRSRRPPPRRRRPRCPIRGERPVDHGAGADVAVCAHDSTAPHSSAPGATWHQSPRTTSCSTTAAVLTMQPMPMLAFTWTTQAARNCVLAPIFAKGEITADGWRTTTNSQPFASSRSWTVRRRLPARTPPMPFASAVCSGECSSSTESSPSTGSPQSRAPWRCGSESV